MEFYFFVCSWYIKNDISLLNIRSYALTFLSIDDRLKVSIGSRQEYKCNVVKL